MEVYTGRNKVTFVLLLMVSDSSHFLLAIFRTYFVMRSLLEFKSKHVEEREEEVYAIQNCQDILAVLYLSV